MASSESSSQYPLPPNIPKGVVIFKIFHGEGKTFHAKDTEAYFNVLGIDVRNCFTSETRILWTCGWGIPPFENNPDRNFIIELTATPHETTAADTENLVRTHLGERFVPGRVKSGTILLDEKGGRAGELYLRYAVWESGNKGIKNLSQVWESATRKQRDNIINRLGRMQYALRLVGELPDGASVWDDVLKRRIREPVLLPARAVDNWSVTGDGDGEDVEALARPLLALLNPWLPKYCAGQVEIVRENGKGKDEREEIAVSVRSAGVEPRTFTYQDLHSISQNKVLQHSLIDISDVFVIGAGDDCTLAAVIGWEKAEWCTPGYTAGKRDSLLGTEITDVKWYLALRREGGFGRPVLSPPDFAGKPEGVKIAELMHAFNTSNSSSSLRPLDRAAIQEREGWLEKRGFRWGGGTSGWVTELWDEERNILRDGLDHKG